VRYRSQRDVERAGMLVHYLWAGMGHRWVRAMALCVQAQACAWLGHWYKDVEQNYFKARNCYKKALALEPHDSVVGKSTKSTLRGGHQRGPLSCGAIVARFNGSFLHEADSQTVGVRFQVATSGGSVEMPLAGAAQRTICTLCRTSWQSRGRASRTTCPLQSPLLLALRSP
jgi:hypothetical protein